MAYIYDLVDTWNDGATTFTAVKMNVTDTASNAASLLMDLQVGGSSQFNITKQGIIRFASTIGLGSSGSGSVDFYSAGTGATNSLLRITNGSTSQRSDGTFGWSATTTVGTNDTILSRRAAANLRLGAADTTGTTAPTAQFLSAQSWASSTTNNQTGANFTIDGSQGTGTGAGGSIIFRVAPAGGTSNGVQNALATALTIGSDKSTRLEGDLNFSGTGTVNIQANVNFLFIRSGTYRWGIGQDFIATSSTAFVGFSSGGTDIGGTTATNVDTRLYRDAANTLALRNGTTAQTFRVYNTYTSDINYESGRLQWVGNEWRIGPETVGGSLRSMGLYVGSTRYQIIGSSFNQFDQSVYMNGANITTDTSTGFKIGTGATQKIGFWNATPIAQPTTAVAAATVAATGVGDVVAASTTFDGYTIPQIVKAMRNAGLLA